MLSSLISSSLTVIVIVGTLDLFRLVAFNSTTLAPLMKLLISSFSKCQQNRAERSLKKSVSTFLFCPLWIAYWYLCGTYLLVSSNTKRAQGVDVWLNAVVVIVELGDTIWLCWEHALHLYKYSPPTSHSFYSFCLSLILELAVKLRVFSCGKLSLTNNFHFLNWRHIFPGKCQQKFWWTLLFIQACWVQAIGALDYVGTFLGF